MTSSTIRSVQSRLLIKTQAICRSAVNKKRHSEVSIDSIRSTGSMMVVCLPFVTVYSIAVVLFRGSLPDHALFMGVSTVFIVTVGMLASRIVNRSYSKNREVILRLSAWYESHLPLGHEGAGLIVMAYVIINAAIIFIVIAISA